MGYTSKQGLTERDNERLQNIFREWSIDQAENGKKVITASMAKGAVEAFVGLSISDDTFKSFAGDVFDIHEVGEGKMEEVANERALEGDEGNDDCEEEVGEGKEMDEEKGADGVEGESGNVGDQEEDEGPDCNVKETEEKHADALELSLDFEAFEQLVCDIYAPAYVYGKQFSRAAARGDVGSMEAFIERGCDPNFIDGHGYTPLHYAAEAGSLIAVKYLLEHIP